MKKVRGLLYRVGQEPVLTEVEESSESFQAVVGGAVEFIEMEIIGLGRFAIVCHDKRDKLAMPPNRRLEPDIIRGDFVVVAWSDEDSSSYLDDGAVEVVKRMFQPC